MMPVNFIEKEKREQKHFAKSSGERSDWVDPKFTTRLG